MTPDLFLLRRLSFRSVRAHPARTVLTLAGITLGVGVFLAIRLANQGTLAGFRNTFNAVAGRAALEVTAQGEPFDEEVFTKIRETPGVRLAGPLLLSLVAALPEKAAPEGRLAPGSETPGPDKPQGVPLLVLGIDILSEGTFRDYEFAGEEKTPPEDIDRILRRLLAPDTVFVTDRFAARYGLRTRDALVVIGPAGPRRLTIQGLLRSAGGGRASPASAMDGSVALMDIAATQEAFGRLGRLDRVDVLPNPDIGLEKLAERIREVLPGGLSVARPARRSRQSERLLAAFQLNLTILSYIALLVGLFIIYNTMSVTVVRRRREWGVLRSLGVDRRGIFGFVLLEAAVQGAAGAGLGILLGTFLGRAALGAVSRTVGNLYVPVGAAQVSLAPSEALLALGAGTASALLSALLPAAAAARMSVRESIHRGDATTAGHVRTGWMTAVGVSLLGAAALLTRFDPIHGVPLFGYVSAFGIVAGFALLTPLSLRLFSTLFGFLRLSSGGAVGMLMDLTRSAGKNGVAVASLAVAVAMLVSVSIMVASFRSTMESWIGRRLRADLYVNPIVRFIGNRSAVLPRGVAEAAARTLSVRAVDGFRTRRITYRDWRILLGAGDLRVLRDHGGLTFLSGERRDILDRARAKGEALVSEVFSNRFGLGRGDRVTLDTAKGPRPFRIAGVFYDYSTEGGLVILDRGIYARLWADDRVSALAVYVQPGADPGRVKEDLYAALGARRGVAVFENRRLRRHILRIFDQTFAITYALEGVALVAAVLGIVTALLTNVLERTREIGLLRVIGFDRKQVSAWVVGEAAAIGLLANALGLLAGGPLALLLIFVINKQSFGWTIQLHWPPLWLAGYFGLTLAAAVLGALWPARAAANVEVKEAVHFE